MSQRENPATAFIARTLCAKVHGPWDEMPGYVQRAWFERASDLIITMYAAGFTIPQPADPDAVWASIHASTERVR